MIKLHKKRIILKTKEDMFMKKRILLPCAAGAGVAVIALAASWLADFVFHVDGLSFQDMAFFLGLIGLLLGLISLTRGGRSSHASTACTPYNATAQTAFSTQAAYQDQKTMSDPKLVRREKGPGLAPAGIALLAAGAVALAVYGVTLLGVFAPDQAVDLPPGKLAYRGEHVGFTDAEIRELSEQMFCCKTKTTYWSDAIKSLSLRETMAYRARKAGLTITDQEAREAAAGKRKSMEADLGYQALIQALTEPEGITEEEYWASLPQERAYRQELLTEKFRAQLKEEFVKENGGDETLWNSYLEEYQKTAVEEEHIREAGR